MNKISSEIVELLNKYSDSNKDGLFLSDYLSRLSESKPIIPVLGMQGMGKSTLINALLEENILPNEADETTCVPVEVVYGENERAEVFFKDSKGSVEVNTLKDLQGYVDNNFNPANEKGVSRIVLYRKKSILESGIVIVDLPGVGSVTSANEETTYKYIQNLCTAIFVIPTVPTIRKTEALFIKSVWSQFSKAIFVQNDWGESKQEIAESVEHNTKLLKGLAHDLNNKFENDDVIVVNAYNAIAGALRNDKQLRDSSNIGTLVSTINGFASNWNKLLTEGAKEKTIMTIDSAIRYAKKILEEFSQSQEETVRKRELELREDQSATNRLEEEISQICSFLGQKESDVRSSARTKASDCVKKIRAVMNKTIDAGVFDGDALSNTFRDVQQEKTTECLNSLFDEINTIKNNVDEKVYGLCDVVVENDMKANPIVLDTEEKYKYEKDIDVLCKIGGGIGAVYAGVATTGAIAAAVETGTLTGTLAFPGVGTAIGAVVGLVIGIIGVIIGKYSKKGIQSRRATGVKQELEPYYTQIENAIKETVTNKFNDYSGSVKSVLNKVVEMRRNQEKEKRTKLYDFDDAGLVDEIENDIKILATYKSSL